jgi:hypothetical protein
MLSEPLRDEIYLHVHEVILNSCPIFKENYDQNFLSQTLKTFK